MSTFYQKSLLYALAALCCSGVLFAGATLAVAQTDLPEGTTQSQIDEALQDLSATYGSPVVRVDQAKAICNDEQYFLACAEIGKKHNLFDSEREAQVDTIVSELKGSVVEQMTQCSDVDCLVGVASGFAKQFNKEHPAVARAVDLTPQKVSEKSDLVAAAKSAGVDFEQCRTMDPDTADIDLLRACARLAKDERIQKYIPEQTRENSDKSDASIALKEGLAKGEIACGDGTMEGCGNFCLNPSTDAQAQGASAIPPICREIAQRFFGQEGVEHLEEAYATVQQTKEGSARSTDVVFTTTDGRTLANPEAIGRYLEEAAQRGDVEAVKKGMDFMVAKGFVTPAERDFALKMVEKIKDRGAIDFDQCRTNPEACRDFVPEDHQGEFFSMGQVDKIMRTEMNKRGVTDPRRCEFDPSIGRACMDAAQAALPQLEALAPGNPQIAAMVGEMRQKIRFGEEAFSARQFAEERIGRGGFTIGDKQFQSMGELEAFCRENPQECLAETARTGVFSRDVATEKYQYSVEKQWEQYSPQEKFTSLYQPRPADEDPGSVAPNRPNFDKEAALKAFEAWLDNPVGPPPMPKDPRGRNDDGSMYPYPYPNACPMVSPKPCPAGEYRQESRNSQGCFVYGSCILFTTKTMPKPIDGKTICPAMPTVDSCPAGQEKSISYSSPECGTYYTCYPKREDTSMKFPYTFRSGKITPSYEGARSYCYESGPNGATSKGDLEECTSTFGFAVPPIPPEKQCAHYGAGWHPVDSSGNCFNAGETEYRTPGGTLQQCATARVWGCSYKAEVPQCSDGKDNDEDGKIDYPDDTSCYGKEDWDETSAGTTPGTGKQQVWNSYGLQSWIREDASPTRIASLKAACANVRSGANVWMSGAGDYANSDFGMPDADKCTKAASCASGQYFDGSTCSTSDSWPDQSSSCWPNTTEASCKAVSGCMWDTTVGGSPCMPSAIESTTSSGSPSAPSLSATVSGTSVKLTWDNSANADKKVTKFKLWRKKPYESQSSPGSWSSLAEVGSGEESPPLSYTDASAPQSGVITYQVQACNDSGCSADSNQVTATITKPQCSDNKDNDADRWVDYPNDSGCDSAEDNNETYVQPPTTTTTTSTNPGDANSCPGFAYSRWDSAGKRYCQLSGETKCDYEYPSYLTVSNYSMAKCPVSNTTNTTGSCSSELNGLLGSGCHNMGNAWFNGEMTKYVMPNTTEVKSCATASISGCSSGGPTTTTTSNSNWVNKTWKFVDGSTQFSAILNRTDSEYLDHIQGVYNDCATKYYTGWMSGGGDQSNWREFGIPSCSSTKPASGTTSTTGTTGSTGTTATGSSSMQRCFYPNATINGNPPGYTVWCEKDYYNCHVGEPSGATVSLNNLALGAPSSCESGWTNGSTGSTSGSGTCGSYTSMSSCVANAACNWNTSGNYCMYNTNSTSSSCPSGQYWNGSACANNTTSAGCGTYSTMSTCAANSTCRWDPANYCVSNTTSSTSCSSGQYWNGSACVATDYSSAQSGCTSAGGTWDSSSNYCQMPSSSSSSSSCGSGYYWNGSSCVSSSSTGGSTSGGTTDYSSMQSGCASAGGTWNSSSNYCQMPSSYFCPTGHSWTGSHCTFAQKSTQEKFTASVLAAFLALFGL